MNQTRNSSGDCTCTSGYEVFGGKCVTVCPSGQTRGSDGSCVSTFSPITFEVYAEDIARMNQFYFEEGIEIWRESLKIPSGATIKLKWNQENNYYKHYYNNSDIGIKLPDLPEGATEYIVQVLPTERMYNPRACGEEQDDTCILENISALFPIQKLS